MTDADLRSYVQSKIQQSVDAINQGYETLPECAVGYEAWQTRKKELTEQGWEPRLYTEECLNWMMWSGLFQRRKS
jgi:hypothetical protein